MGQSRDRRHAHYGKIPSMTNEHAATAGQTTIQSGPAPADPPLRLTGFSSPFYREHNRARLDHLASLGLPLSNARVLELGAGPGDHTGFYLSRNCDVVSVDARQACLDQLAMRFPSVQCVLCDLNEPDALTAYGQFPIVHCYGVLYHLQSPERLLQLLGKMCSGLVVLETCVSPDHGSAVEWVGEDAEDFTQSSTGQGCRPSRQWVFSSLQRYFPYVYQTTTQPDHPEFPTDWNDLSGAPPLIRSVFVASKHPLSLPRLSPRLLDLQERFQPSQEEIAHQTAASTELPSGVSAAQLTPSPQDFESCAAERKSLARLLGNHLPALRVIDVGALQAPVTYERLLDHPGTSIVGFDAIPETCDELNRTLGPAHRFYPYTIADGRKSKFYQCNYVMTSSLLKPDLDFMGEFQNLANLCQPVATTEFATVRLDDVPEAMGADFLKLDVQGAEGLVLSGASLCLESILIVQTEVEFAPIYEGQPLFADIDSMLRSRGFAFHRFVSSEGRPLLVENLPAPMSTTSQLLWADAVYIRPIPRWSSLSSEQILKLAFILDSVCRSSDFCARLLQIHDARERTDFFDRYVSRHR